MTAFPWSQVFEEQMREPDDATPISASPGKWVAAVTTVFDEGDAKHPHLSFGSDIFVTLELWAIPFKNGPRMVMLASPAQPGLGYRSLAWCRFPHRTDLMEVSRFVPGRNRDDAWRAEQIERAAGAPDPIAFLKRELTNVVDSSNRRDTALFGCPRQLHKDVLVDAVAEGDATRRGPLNKKRFDKVVSINELWTHRGEHPDVVLKDSPAALLAAEFRWALLPSLSPQRSPENELGEPPDFAIAKERVKSEQPMLALLDDVERGLLRFEGQSLPLHEAVKERALQLVDYAVERALCGPRDGNKLGRDRRVSTFARRIATYELYNQNRRWATWGASIVERDADTVGKEVTHFDPAQGYQDLVEDLRDARGDGIDDLGGDDALIARVNALLDLELSPKEVIRGCAALQVLLEDRVKLPRLNRYVARLETLVQQEELPRWLRTIASGLNATAAGTATRTRS